MSSKIPAVDNGNAGSLPRLERNLGETETSYYLPSREDGVNDMCVTTSDPHYVVY